MASRTILLKGCPELDEDGVAGEEIRPGHLVEGVTTILKFSTAGGPAARRFALERDELGKGIDNTYQSEAGSAYYSVGDAVKVHNAKPGDRVLALIDSGVNVAADGWLEPAGNGTLRALASGTPIARALEAKNVTETSFIRVEVY